MANLPSGGMALATTHFDFSALGADDWTAAATANIGNGVTAETYNPGTATTFGPNGTTGIRFNQPTIAPLPSGGYANRLMLGFPIDSLFALNSCQTIYLCAQVDSYTLPTMSRKGWGLGVYGTLGAAMGNYIGHRVYKENYSASWPMILDAQPGLGFLIYTFSSGANRRRIAMAVNTGTGLFECWSSDTVTGVAPDWSDLPGDDFDLIPTMTPAYFRAPAANGYNDLQPRVLLMAYAGNEAIDVVFTDLWVATVQTS
jgi:hypothetical protein